MHVPVGVGYTSAESGGYLTIRAVTSLSALSRCIVVKFELYELYFWLELYEL